MNPDIADVHVNTLLTSVSVGYKPSGFFAPDIFPMVSVDNQTDIYPVYNKSFWARDTGSVGAAPQGSAQAVRRAPGTIARTVGYTLDNTNVYRCLNYALGMEIPDELRANADSVFNLDRDATTLLDSLLRLRIDREVAADIIVSGGWGTLTVTNKWSDYAASTPIEDIRTGAFTLRQNTLGMSVGGGLKMVVGALVDRRLKDHPDLIARIQYGSSAASPAMVTDNLIAQLFGVDEYRVANSVYTDSEEGTAEASASYSDVVSDDVLLYWTPPSGQQLAPSAGYLFNWASMAGGPKALFFARKGRDDRARKDWVELHGYLDFVVCNSSSGVVSTDAVD